ncbi:60S ribosomal protein L4-like [Leopardus geoffroyi]|uniref:60S ribosomal protein L4-like n=1 Tax=Leopardus geoffroyi TaxID=46844 RepID=UPI001E25D922|nr:60S ribosomal protein L4-like [Leopardus geoffroyi]
MHKMLNTHLSRILKSPRDPQRPPSTTQQESLQSPEEESPAKPENRVEAKPVYTDHVPDTILCQAENHKLRMNKAAAALEAKSDEKGVPGKRPLGGKKGKKGSWCEEAEETFGRKTGCSYQEISCREAACRGEIHHRRKDACYIKT